MPLDGSPGGSHLWGSRSPGMWRPLLLPFLEPAADSSELPQKPWDLVLGEGPNQDPPGVRNPGAGGWGEVGGGQLTMLSSRPSK